MRSLLLGAGKSRLKKVELNSAPGWKGPLTTLDIDPSSADVVWDLNDRPLPFEDEAFDQIGAYDVLEHIGKQGDWRSFFDEFAEYWRILKPGGEFGILVPIGDGRFGDPGHVRFFHPNHFGFLNQKFYADNIAAGTNATDYRWYWKRNFEIAFVEQTASHLAVILIKG